MAGDFSRGRAIVFEQPDKAVVKNIRLADIDDETVVVKTRYSGISCGTEMAVYHGEAGGDGVRFPCVPGYEGVGEVVYAGKKAMKSNTGEILRVGDRVMANEVRFYPDYYSAWGGQCGYAVKNPKTSPFPADRPARIPDNVSYQEAVVVYLLCVAKKGLDMVGINRGETVLVTGLGQVGLSTVQLAGLYGAGRVIAADVRADRLPAAKRYTGHILDLSSPGAVRELMDMTDGKKADVVVECSGNPAAVPAIPDFIRAGGRVHLTGHYRKPVVITHYSAWNCSDLRISCSIALNPGSKEDVLRLISEGKVDAKNLYTTEYAVDEAPKAYEDLEKNRYDILKILLKWD